MGLCLALAACAPAVPPTKAQPITLDLPMPLPAMRVFPQRAAPAPRRANAEMAQDFLDLEFRMESGRALTAITRFDGPITVSVTGQMPATAQDDLDRLMARLRNEAGIDIRQVEGVANLTIAFVPKAELQRIVPTAACFVVPNVAGLAEYRRKRGTGQVDWAGLPDRKKATIFVPNDTSPQEIRDCLHEETAQALGPLNDLYRLPDSVFNDDNFHAVLTGFDMLMLRVHYAPELRNGMTREEVSAVLPGVLARLNPRGEKPGRPVPPDGPRAWVDAIETAFGSQEPLAQRQRAAVAALDIARDEGWNDPRLGFSWFVLARLLTGTDAAQAAEAFAQARQIYAGLPDCALQVAHVDMQLAAFALSQGDAEKAGMMAQAAIPAATGAENAALLSTLMQIRAEALQKQGQAGKAQDLRVESLGWARYGFGPDVQVIARLADIAALAARGPGG